MKAMNKDFSIGPPDDYDLYCFRCLRSPSEINEYVEAAKEDNVGYPDVTPEQYVWREEGTLNRKTGHFLCTECYIDAGMPSAPGGWVAP